MATRLARPAGVTIQSDLTPERHSAPTRPTPERATGAGASFITDPKVAPGFFIKPTLMSDVNPRAALPLGGCPGLQSDSWLRTRKSPGNQGFFK
jgi:hypothetical protein